MVRQRELTTLSQTSAYDSPWSLRVRLKFALWSIVWLLLYRPTPKPFSPWRVLLLRLFGCQVTGRPFVSQSASIRMPWNLTLEDRACLGENCVVYNLGPVVLRQHCTVAQEVYLCAGTHDFSRSSLPLVVGLIDIGPRAFVGARAFVLPGVIIGEGAIVGACAVVDRDVSAFDIVAGNRATTRGKRTIQPEV